MSINEANIKAGAKEMVNQLDHAKTRQDAEVVADRLRADYMDCMGQGSDGKVRWQHLVQALKTGEVQGQGFDLQVKGDPALPVVILVDSQKGITIGGLNIGRDALTVNEDHSSRKGFLPDAESGITNTRRLPIEMQ